ncbi:hypothetical protein Bca4012_011329 [Brassica carinata]
MKLSLPLRLVSAFVISFMLVSASFGVVTPGKSPGAKVFLPPTPCSEDDCGFVCRHRELQALCCPGVRCYCLDNP